MTEFFEALIELEPETISMLESIRHQGSTTLFPTRNGNPYTDSGFNTMWQRALKAARAEGITQAFTFHDLRAYYTTEHKEKHGSLPDLHKNPAVTARIYDRTKETRRRAV